MAEEVSPPWPPEMACDLARMHVEQGDFNGLYVIGTEEAQGIVPCFESPRETAAMLALQVMAGKVPKPQWILFMADTYHIELAEGEPHPGLLEDLFRAGDPRVTEAVVVFCVCPDGPSYQAIQPYVRDEGEIDWGEIEVKKDMSGLGGSMTKMIRAVLDIPYGVAPDAARGIEQIRIPLDAE